MTDGAAGGGNRDKAVAEFYDALRARDRDRLRTLGTADPSLLFSIDPKGCCGGTVMNLAVGFGDTGLLETLLELGADPNQPSEWPPGPFRALSSIPDRYHDHLGPWLIERGAALDAHSASKLGLFDELKEILAADPEALHRKGPDGQRPLHVARTPEIAAWLLDLGADIEAKCVDHGSTPAEYAASHRPDVCRLLLDRGAGGDEFMYAMIGDLDRLGAAIDADPNVLHARTTPDRFTPTEGEAAHIYMYTIGSNATLIHAAVSGSGPEVVRFLVERGLDPNARGGYDDQTAAHGAAWGNRPDMIRLLAECGADVDLPSGETHRNPPAGWGILSGSVEAIEALLELGIRIPDYYLEDARAGIDGRWREFSSATPDRYEAIVAALEAARAARGPAPEGGST